MTGPSPIYDELERVARSAVHAAEHPFDAFRPHHRTSAETPAATRIIRNEPPVEDPVSVLTDIETSANDILGKLRDVDADALDKIDAIKANPEAATVLDALYTVARAELPTG